MDSTRIGRRRFLGSGLALSARPVSRMRADTAQGSGPLRLYWGDLHNHNAVGYAQGSLQRSIEIAREHLDFFAFTGHASWHDMPNMPGNRHLKWVNGFRVHRDHWETTRQLIRDANDATFTALLGYEWHSSQFGDYCVIFPGDEERLYLPDHVDHLLQFAEASSALAIPHHLAYARGWRGANFDHFRGHVSPVVEIFSEHGCSESVTAPVGDFLRHSMGGRVTENTVERQLQRGLRFGFVASSDDHRGYPGAYGEGIVGVWSADHSAASLFDAIRRRRTVAATGDRITLDMTLNDQPMGSELPFVSDRQIDVAVDAPDGVKMIEWVRNGRVVHRQFPEDAAERPAPLPGRVHCRVRYGWGPWGALDLGRVCDWKMTIKVDGGEIVAALPCFQAAPFDEQRRDTIARQEDGAIVVTSHTTRVKAYGEDPTKGIILDIDVLRPDASLVIELASPNRQRIATRLAALQHDNHVTFTGPFTAESLMIERLVGPSERQGTYRWVDRRSDAETTADWYYVRVTQHNGHMAWCSPVWIDATPSACR